MEAIKAARDGRPLEQELRIAFDICAVGGDGEVGFLGGTVLRRGNKEENQEKTRGTRDGCGFHAL